MDEVHTVSASQGKFTDVPEVAAYVLAHAAGIAWGFIVNPMILRGLVVEGHRERVMPVAIGLSIALSIVVLLLFLVLRRVIAGPGAAPPPADAPRPATPFTDLREIAAYVLAHAAGIAWNAVVTPLIFRSLIAQGMRNLMLPAIAMSIAVSIVVLVLFLLLRKAMAARGRPA
jgi:hypothetical protein